MIELPCGNRADAVVPVEEIVVVGLGPLEPLFAGFVESTKGRLCTGCVGELGNVFNGRASGMGGSGTRTAKAGFNPARGVFFAEPFVAEVFAGVVVFPVCTDGSKDNAGAGAPF